MDRGHPHVFISYVRADEADAGRLYDSLVGQLDPKHVRKDDHDFELGADWKRDLTRLLADCAVLVVVMGPTWESSPAFELEFTTAISNGISVVPVLVRGADIKDRTHNLSGDLATLRDRTALELSHRSWQRDIVPLVDLLRRVLADPSRARVIIGPPDPIRLLDNCPSYRSYNGEKALLAHAEDLAECLADPAVKREAESARGYFREQLLEQERAWGAYRDIPPSLVQIVETARRRLRVEQYARELSAGRPDCVSNDVEYAEELACYLEDPSIVEEVRSCEEQYRAGIEDYKDGGMTSRDEIRAAKESLEAVLRAARDRLRSRLPGITKENPRRSWPKNAFREEASTR